MEYESIRSGPTNGFFGFMDEDHTLASAVLFILNGDPKVKSCGYSILHPIYPQLNINVETTGDPPRQVLRESCMTLILICEEVRSTFDRAVTSFRNNSMAED